MSNLSAFPYIQEGAEAKPSLWNDVYSIFSANLAAVDSGVSTVGLGNFQQLSIGSTPPSYLTTAAITVAVNSAFSDYLYLTDSSGARSNYVIGSRAGGTADGLNIWDASGATMIVSFSKQSVRFFQQVVGPVFDVGGALAKTLNAATFGTGADSKESRIQAAILAAPTSGASRVYVPANMYPYSASSVSFLYTVQMVREGGDWSGYDVRAYGAAGDNTTDDRAAINATLAADSTGAPVEFSGGTYLISSLITTGAGRYLRGRAGIAAVSGYTGKALFEVQANCLVENLNFDGRNIPQPSAAWLGVGIPPGSCLYVTGAAARIQDNTFSGFGGGPIFTRSVPDGQILRNSFLSNQSYLTDETNSLIEVYQGDRFIVTQNSLQTYNWKAINVSGNGIKVTENATSGGSTGHAALYSSTCADLLIANNTHDGRAGRGFGIKSFRDQRSLIVGNSLTNCVSGIYIQDSVGAVIVANEIAPSTSYGVIFETTSAATVDCSGTITANQITGSGKTTSITPVGVFLNSGSTLFGLRNTRINSNSLLSLGAGIQSVNSAQAIYEDIEIAGNTFRSCGAYGVLLLAKSGSIADNNFRDCVNPIFVASASTLTSDEFYIADNKFADSSGNLIEIGTGFQCRFNQMAVHDNSGESGTRLLLVDLQGVGAGSALEYIKYLSVTGNSGWNQTNANAFNLTFSSAATGSLAFSHNIARAPGGLNNANFVNGAQVTSGYLVNNDLASVGTPAAMVTAGRFTGASPTAVLREAGGGGVGVQLLRASASGFYNFLIAHGFNFNDILEITPSTAVDGTTFSSPALQIRRTGQVDVPTGPFTVTGAATVTGKLQVAGAGNNVGLVDGTTIAPAFAYSSESSLGWYRSGSSTLALSYGTIDLTASGAMTSIASLKIKAGTNNSCGTAVLGSNGSVNVANTYVKTGDLIFLTDQTPGGTLGNLEILGIRNSSGFTIASTGLTDTSTVAWLIVRPG